MATKLSREDAKMMLEEFIGDLTIERFYYATQYVGPLRSGYRKESWRRPNTVGWHNGWAREVTDLKNPYLSVKLSNGHWYKPHKFLSKSINDKISKILLAETIDTWKGKTFKELIDFFEGKIEGA